MGLKLVTPPTQEPVTLAQAKLHCKVEVTQDDERLTDWIRAAREAAEGETWRALLTQEWRWSVDRFPAADAIWLLPKGQLQAVVSLKYFDATGTLVTLPATEYVVDADSEPARLRLAYGKSWPATYDILNAVQLTFRCGWASPEDVPRLIKSGMLLLIGHWYKNRESTISGTIIAKVPDSVERCWRNLSLKDFRGAGAFSWPRD